KAQSGDGRRTCRRDSTQHLQVRRRVLHGRPLSNNALPRLYVMYITSDNDVSKHHRQFRPSAGCGAEICFQQQILEQLPRLAR
ncbi:hypothetical protein, partial [Mycolicibacterium houstonense]|uniref:hypothetical protein n=1 Tax=Mycolicibacterium houstonense TaxID=146021 RepID=UPI001C661E2C